MTLVGEDVILPCCLVPPLDAVSKRVAWGRPDLEPRFVHVWHEGQNHLVNQNPSYKGRTSLSIDNLKQGDFSLHLSAVKLSDNGVYRCYFPSQDKTFYVELVVSYISSSKKNKKDQLRRQSMKTQEEFNAWVAVLSPSMELSTRVGNQSEELRLQLEEIEKQREENKRKVKLVEKEIAASEKEKATDKTEGYLREKQSLLDAQWKLEKRKEEVEKQQLNMEKLLLKTEGMMAKMTEMKRTVENQMEVINLSLEEVDSEDGNAHLHRE
ncbi:uncharacterized protein [Pagrus major]|uniref:uncharacterized protein n=1 Tax=Pagrus major TaxID=143350 RepID=UPI003CC84550